MSGEVLGSVFIEFFIDAVQRSIGVSFYLKMSGVGQIIILIVHSQTELLQVMQALELMVAQILVVLQLVDGVGVIRPGEKFHLLQARRRILISPRLFIQLTDVCCRNPAHLGDFLKMAVDVIDELC